MDAWHHGRKLRDASFAAAAAWIVSAGIVAWVAPGSARLALVLGVAAGATLGLLWHLVPKALGRPVERLNCGWAALSLWQVGTALVLAADLRRVDAQLGELGGFMLFVGAVLALDELGTVVVASGAWRRAAFWRAMPFIATAAVQLPLATLFLAISFRPDALPGLRTLGALLLGVGFVVPSAVLVLGAARRPADGLKSPVAS